MSLGALNVLHVAGGEGWHKVQFQGRSADRIQLNLRVLVGTGGRGWFVSEAHSLEPRARQGWKGEVSRMLPRGHLLGSSCYCFVVVLTKGVYLSCIKELETTVSVCSVFCAKGSPREPSSLASCFVLS